MGCASSKILTRSGSFQEESNQTLNWSYSGLQELLNSEKNNDQLFALNCAANPVARKIESPAPPENNLDVPVDFLDPKAIVNEKDKINVNSSPETDTETINSCELSAGLEEGEGAKGYHEDQKEEQTELSDTTGSEPEPVPEEHVFDNVPDVQFSKTISLKDWLLSPCSDVSNLI